jgi:hypothetical protein
VPLYGTSKGGHTSWSRYTLANIPDDPSATQLWAPVIFAYIFSAYYCRLMQKEYINFMKKRVEYLIQGDPDTPAQTYYTAIVEHIPAQLRSNHRLFNFFNNLFPGQF